MTQFRSNKGGRQDCHADSILLCKPFSALFGCVSCSQHAAMQVPRSWESERFRFPTEICPERSRQSLSITALDCTQWTLEAYERCYQTYCLIDIVSGHCQQASLFHLAGSPKK